MAGDFGYSANAQATFSAAGGAGLDFFLVVGDTTYGDTTESTWCSAFRAQVGHVLVEPGNHDIGESPGASLGPVLAACPYDLTDPMAGTYGRQWYVDYPAGAPLARLILTGCGDVFDAGNGSTWACAAGDAHYKFVSDALDGARSASIPWVIVGMHKNCLSSGTKSCEIGADFFNLLLDKRVDLVLQGHDHLYERSKQLACATPNLYRAACVADDGADGRYTKGGGPVVNIVGNGGRSLYALNPADSEAGYFAVAFNDTYGFVKYTVNRTEIRADFVRSAGGSASDSFVIEPPAPDTAPPNLILTAPANGSVTNRSSVWLAGTTEPGARVSVGGVEATVGGNGSFGLAVALAPGANVLFVTAWDGAGNQANATLDVTFQDPVPVLEAQLAQARLDLAAAQARVDVLGAEANATQALLVAVEADLTSAEASLALAEASVAALQSGANATQGELEGARANLTAAQASLVSTQGRMAALQADANKTHADLEAARVNVSLALGMVSAVELEVSSARAAQNATQADLGAARGELAAAQARAAAQGAELNSTESRLADATAQSASALSQAGIAMALASVGIAVGAISAVWATRSRPRRDSEGLREPPPQAQKGAPPK